MPSTNTQPAPPQCSSTSSPSYYMTPPNQINPNPTSSSSPQALLTHHTYQHTLPNTPQNRASHSNLRGSNFSNNPVATPTVVQDSSWFMDSGATDHVAFDHSQLAIASTYQGSEQLQAGNGKNLTILTLVTFPFLVLFIIKHCT